MGEFKSKYDADLVKTTEEHNPDHPKVMGDFGMPLICIYCYFKTTLTMEKIMWSVNKKPNSH